ncbi:hypothetical protein DRQ50_09420, partial [bacterium]
MYALTRPYGFVCALVATLVGLALTGPAANASTVEPSQQISTTSAQNPTLGIPRWKGWIDPANPDRMWASFAGNSSSANNVVYSADGGLNWSTHTINPNNSGYLNYHVSLFGKGSDLYFTFPGSGIDVRRFTAPATSNDDRLPLVTMSGTSSRHRSSVMVDGDGRVWVFSRLSNSPSDNVHYHYSDDDGQTWTAGTVVATGSPNVRIGSMPYVDGRACVVILHLNSSRGYEYYLWNGSSFEARADHTIRGGDVGYQRAFAHNVVNGSTFHLVYAANDELRHVWKDDQNGSGTWNEQVIETHDTMDAMLWSPSLTTRGSELFLFYSRWDSSEASAQIYVRRLVDGSSAWEDPVQVSVDGLTYNVHPNTAFSVPVTSDYIPVFWTTGSGHDRIRFARIAGSSVPADDITAPARIKDLQAATTAASDEVQVQWTATGDDNDVGQAVSYDLRYSTSPINETSWDTAIPVTGEPVPAPSGEHESMVVRNLETGTSYLFGLRVADDADNVSDVSNIVWAKVGAISHASRVPFEGAVLAPNRPNPFNPR